MILSGFKLQNKLLILPQFCMDHDNYFKFESLKPTECDG